MKIFLDADASPITQLAITFAKDNDIEITIVKNYSTFLETSYGEIVEVDVSRESADLYIVNHMNKRDLVLTNDRALSALVLAKEGYVLDFFGNEINDYNINTFLTTRHESRILRNRGIYTKNKKRSKEDNTKFLKSLEEIWRKYDNTIR